MTKKFGSIALLVGLGVGGIGWGHHANGQTLPEKTLSDCHLLEDSAERLECYDVVTAFEAEQVDDELPATEEAQNEPAANALIDTFVSQVSAAIQAGHIEEATRYFQNSPFSKDLPEVSIAGLEEVALAYVRPIPSSQAQQNLNGYRLLAVLRPDNAQYQGKECLINGYGFAKIAA
jgi:hypothetical protein